MTKLNQIVASVACAIALTIGVGGCASPTAVVAVPTAAAPDDTSNINGAYVLYNVASDIPGCRSNFVGHMGSTGKTGLRSEMTEWATCAVGTGKQVMLYLFKAPADRDSYIGEGWIAPGTYATWSENVIAVPDDPTLVAQLQLALDQG